MTYSGGNPNVAPYPLKIYINGVPQALSFAGTVTNNGASYNTTDSNYAIGYDPTDSGRNWSGYMSDVRIYNRALSQDDISGGSGNPGNPSPPDYTTGLVGWWNMEEGTGASTADSSGSGNDGAIRGLSDSGARWTSTNTYGNGSQAALSFSGTDGCVLANSVATDQTSGWTMTAWIDPAILEQQSNVVLNGTDNNNNGNGYSFGIDNGKLEGLADGVAWIDTGYSFSAPDQWYHIVMTQTGSETDFYVNGQLVAHPSFNSYAAPSKAYGPYGVAIGCQYGSGAFRDFNGTIDDIRIYNRPFSSDDVTALYDYYLANGLNQNGQNQSNAPQGPTPLSGWAWSSNIGWLSFNSNDSGAGGGAAYNVTVSTSTAGCSMTEACFGGYAWSPNIGWVSFEPDDISAAPSCGLAATADLTTGTVSGFARAYSGIGAANGWDGCIALSGTILPSPWNSSTNFLSPDFNTITILGKQYLAGGMTFQTQTLSSGDIQGTFGGFGWENSAIGWLNFGQGFGVGGNAIPSPTFTPVHFECGGPGCGAPTAKLALDCASQPLNGSNEAVWIATASGGSGTGYTINWSSSSINNLNAGGPSSGASPSTYTQSTALNPGDSASIAVSVTDGDNNTARGSCSPISRINPATHLKLLISGGSSVPIRCGECQFPSGYSSATVTKGQPFVLGWYVNLSADYSWLTAGGCDCQITGAIKYSSSLGSVDLSGLQSGVSNIRLVSPFRHKFWPTHIHSCVVQSQSKSRDYSTSDIKCSFFLGRRDIKVIDSRRNERTSRGRLPGRVWKLIRKGSEKPLRWGWHDVAFGLRRLIYDYRRRTGVR